MDLISFKVERDDDLADLESRGRAATASPCSRDLQGRVGRAGRVDPLRDPVRTADGARPRRRAGRRAAAQGQPAAVRHQGLAGIAPPRIDHVLVTAEEVGEATRFYTKVLGFRLTEQLLDGNGHQIGIWMERSHSPHDLAVVTGANGGLHHFAFWLDDWDHVRKAADILAYNGDPDRRRPDAPRHHPGQHDLLLRPAGHPQRGLHRRLPARPRLPDDHLDRGQHRPRHLLLRGRAQRPVHEGAHLRASCACAMSRSGCPTSSWRPPTTPRSSGMIETARETPSGSSSSAGTSTSTTR